MTYLYRKDNRVVLSTDPKQQGTVQNDQTCETDWIRVAWDNGNERNMKRDEIILLSTWERAHGKRGTMSDPLYDEIGQRIRTERKALGFTQTDLASCVGYERPTSISEIEAGKIQIPVHVLVAIADALGVSLACLLPEQEATR